MADHCNYDCSRHPDKIEFDSDITGPGVIVGYVAAAALPVLLIIVHYFLAYQPDLDPFRDMSNAGPARAVPFEPNPVDLIILGYAKRPFRVKTSSSSRWFRFNRPLTKCILAMSDLQLGTGIAILISGYVQLRCGLSSYHWLVIGRLAWFSSLTHLSCLTVLRNYLHNRKSERQWRLALMLVLIVMLITAIIPTGRYDWAIFDDLTGSFTGSGPKRSDYAICSFSTLPPAYPVNTLLPMVVLVLLAGTGFIIRAIKLHEPLAVMMVKMRAHISQGLRLVLWILYGWKTRPRGLRRFTGDILYYAALAIFLSLRLIADHFSSMFFEVFWLFASFLVGSWSLRRAMNPFPPDSGFQRLFEGVSSNKWSFGQVMPIILLALPLVNTIESLYPDGQAGVSSNMGAVPTHNVSNSASILLETPGMLPVVNRPMLNPNQNYYRYTTAMGAGTAYILVCELGLLGFALLYGFGSSPVFAVQFLRLGCIIPLVGLWAVILVSFPIDILASRKGTAWYLRALQPVNVVLIACVSGWLTFTVSSLSPV